MDNVRVVVVPMPTAVKAYTVCKDGFYTIVLNDNISYEQRYKAYMHEIMHINNRDFEKKSTADLIEFYSHKEVI